MGVPNSVSSRSEKMFAFIIHQTVAFFPCISFKKVVLLYFSLIFLFSQKDLRAHVHVNRYPSTVISPPLEIDI
jgi:hypothetical protein